MGIDSFFFYAVDFSGTEGLGVAGVALDKNKRTLVGFDSGVIYNGSFVIEGDKIKASVKGTILSGALLVIKQQGDTFNFPIEFPKKAKDHPFSITVFGQTVSGLINVLERLP